MNIRFDEDPFAKNAPGIGKIYLEVLKLMKFLQTKHQAKNMDINYYDLYYTVIENGDEKEIVDNQYGSDFFSLNDVFKPIHYVGKNSREI